MRWTAFILLVGLAGCGRDETVFSYGAGERSFVLQSVDGAAFAGTATIGFPTPGRVAGQAPCNSYSGALTVPYPWFELGPLAVTKRACLSEGGEAAFFQALLSMSLVRVEDGTLRLWNDSGREMIFSEQPGG